MSPKSCWSGHVPPCISEISIDLCILYSNLNKNATNPPVASNAQINCTRNRNRLISRTCKEEHGLTNIFLETKLSQLFEFLSFEPIVQLVSDVQPESRFRLVLDSERFVRYKKHIFINDSLCSISRCMSSCHLLRSRIYNLL